MIAAMTFILTRVGASPGASTPDIRLVFYSLAWVGIVVGIGLALWGIVLLLAHSKVATHWCPDPEAHQMRTEAMPTAVPEGAPHLPMALGDPIATARTGELLSVLRQIRMDLKLDRQLLESAVSTGRYWPLSGDQLRDRAWKKSCKQLMGQPSVPIETYDTLNAAFGHVRRLNGKIAPRRLINRSLPKPEDRLTEALQAVSTAEARVEELITPSEVRLDK